MVIRKELDEREVLTIVNSVKTMLKLDSLCNGEMFQDTYLDLLALFPIGSRLYDLNTMNLQESIVWETWVKFINKSSPEELAQVLISGVFNGITPSTTPEEIHDMVSIDYEGEQ